MPVPKALLNGLAATALAGAAWASTAAAADCSASSIAVNQTGLGAGFRLYRAGFSRDSWTGDLTGHRLAQNCAQTGCGAGWSAAARLESTAPQARTILTANAAGAGIPFRHPDLSPAQQARLSPEQVNYLRGSRAGAGALRTRAGLLGAIVHSDPLFVGAPDRIRYPRDWDDERVAGNQTTIEDRAALAYRSAGTNDFLRAHATRAAMVYVGANDGMLHGFEAATGRELLAFVPPSLIPTLGAFTNPGFDHGYTVDGSPVAVDAVIATDHGPAWKTILVAGLRGGGRGVFALDITAPGSFAEERAEEIVLWEFTDPALGLSYGRPAIVRLHHGRWAAVFGNGYHNQAEQSAALFVVDLSSGLLIRKLATGAQPGGANPSYDNGLGSPFPVDLDGDFITDYVYAGDLYGNLWKFDLTATSPGDWRVASGGAPLFTARTSAGVRQPLTTQPQVGAHPYGLDYGVMVYFGSSGLPGIADAAPGNSFYGVWDLDVFTFNDRPAFKTSITSGLTRGRLTRQQVLGDDTSAAANYRLLSQRPVAYQEADDEAAAAGADRRGWVLDLPAGEMGASDAVLRGKVVTFTTSGPGVDSCNPGGTWFFMVVDAATGGRTRFPAFDLNADHRFTKADGLGEPGARFAPSGIRAHAPGSPTLVLDRAHGTDIALLPTADASALPVPINVGMAPEGRRSWRELRR